jgi:hypothetical protein
MAAPARLPEPRRRRQWTRANQRLVGASQLPNAVQGEIGLGTCVRLSLSGGRSVAQMTEEGVVIEVVEPGTGVTSARVAFLRTETTGEPRYVIQCWSRRVLRHASGLVVVSA